MPKKHLIQNQLNFKVFIQNGPNELLLTLLKFPGTAVIFGKKKKRRKERKTITPTRIKITKSKNCLSTELDKITPNDKQPNPTQSKRQQFNYIYINTYICSQHLNPNHVPSQ